MTVNAEQQQSVVSLTESAAGQIRSMLSGQPENSGKILRVYVEGGGCSGMQYGMVFDEKRDNDLSVEFFGVSVLVDPVSAGYLHELSASCDMINDSNRSSRNERTNRIASTAVDKPICRPFKITVRTCPVSRNWRSVSAIRSTCAAFITSPNRTSFPYVGVFSKTLNV